MPFDNPYQTPFGDVEILIDARNRISDQDAWVQGRFQDRGRHCLVAALSLACGSRSVSLPNRTEKRLARVLAKQLRPGSRLWHKVPLIPARQHLMWFNDDSRTRHDDVMALFDRAICNLAIKVPACTTG